MTVADLNTFQARIRSVVRGFHVYKAVWSPVIGTLQLISTAQKIIKAELGAKFEKIRFTSNWRLITVAL